MNLNENNTKPSLTSVSKPVNKSQQTEGCQSWLMLNSAVHHRWWRHHVFRLSVRAWLRSPLCHS